jgi:hypothetical protein
MTNLHLDKTTFYPSCHLNGWLYWRNELQVIVERRGLHLAQFDVFDCREYDSFADARTALIDMIQTGLYTLVEAHIEQKHTVENTKTNERVSGTVQQLARRFNFKSTQSISSLIRKRVGRGRLQDWKLV